MRGTESVTRRRPSTDTDDWGNPIDGSVTETTFERVLVAPGSSAEPEPGRGLVTTKTTIYLPAGISALPTDRWVVRGEEYAQDGEASSWTSAKGIEVGVIVQLERAEG